MSILANAIDSIRLGVEDYESADTRRILSATRNISSGILLLFKHHLISIGGISLIAHDLLPTPGEYGDIEWVKQGSRTVDFHVLKRRMESMGIQVDWRRLESMQKYRNNIEHFFTDVSRGAAEAYVSDALIVLTDFITSQMEEEPRSVLGVETWSKMLGISGLHRKQKQRQASEFDRLDWNGEASRIWLERGRCVECGGDLLYPELQDLGEDVRISAEHCAFKCSHCGWSEDYYTTLSIVGPPDSRYSLWDEKGFDSVGECPECGSNTYDITLKQCASCGEKGPYYCTRCESEIPFDELSWYSGKLCSWRFHMSEKDD